MGFNLSTRDPYVGRVGPTSGGLAGRYAIERDLGRGGMARVYQAQDPSAWISIPITGRS